MGEELQQMRKRLPKWARDGILAGYRGSHAHGTYVPPTDPTSIDDVDVFQICVQPPEFYLGLEALGRQRQHYETAGEELDIVVYDVRKFVGLLRKGNPNVHVWLWLRPEHYFVRTPAAEILISNRHRLLSQHVLNALTGYAAHQIHRMTRFESRGYMGEKRKALVREHGYDCKNAAHCVRLLHMGIDLAETGLLLPHRLECWGVETIMAIKQGEWSLVRVKEYTDGLWIRYNDLRAKANLRPEVPVQEASSIMLQAMRRHWEDHGISH
jgi:predicted nucleotidyltransferase